MVLIKTLTVSLASTCGFRGQQHSLVCTCMALLTAAFLRSSAGEEASPPESLATQSIRQQLEEQTAAQISTAGEIQSRNDAAAAAQKKIDRLRVELKNAVQHLITQQEVRKRLSTKESEAAAAVASLTSQLESHRAVDVLQATADAALSQLNSRRAEIGQWNDRLSELHQESFNADQAARQAARLADTMASQAAKKKQSLEEARLASAEAEFALEEARSKAIQASRTLAERQRMLNHALLDAGRARRTVVRLTGTVTAVEDSIPALQLAVDISAAGTTDAVNVLRTVLGQISPLRTRAERILNTKLNGVKTAREEQVAAAAARVQVESVRREKASAHSALSRQHFAQQREVVRLVADSHQQRRAAEEFAGKKEQLGRDISQVEEKKAEVVAVVDELHRIWVDLQTQAEQAQEPLERFVSFSRNIAPILARRCTACHNTRTPGGRLNLNSFAALLKGGDSGPSLTPHDAEDSLLLTMVQDGSMPKDADPLAAEEIEMIRRWVEVGAPLDAAASASADLFDIMPELPQPLPPATYRLPIPVLATAFSPDGSLLATSGYHEVLLWESQGRLVRRITNVAQRVNDVEFTADGATLVVAAGTPGQLGEVKLFRVADGTHLGTPVRTTDSVYAVAISSDGRRLAAGGADRKIAIVDIETQQIVRTIEDHADAVMDVAWSPASDRIASASFDKSCRVFDAATGEVQRTFTSHGEPVYAVAFQPDGKSLVSAGADRKLRVWPVSDGDQIREIDGFGDHVFRLAVTSDGHVFSAGADRQLREHQLADGSLVRTMTGHKDWVYALAVDARGGRVATGCYDGEVRVWNSTDGTMTRSFVAVPEQGDTTVTVSDRQR